MTSLEERRRKILENSQKRLSKINSALNKDINEYKDDDIIRVSEHYELGGKQEGQEVKRGFERENILEKEHAKNDIKNDVADIPLDTPDPSAPVNSNFQIKIATALLAVLSYFLVQFYSVNLTGIFVCFYLFISTLFNYGLIGNGSIGGVSVMVKLFCLYFVVFVMCKEVNVVFKGV